MSTQPIDGRGEASYCGATYLGQANPRQGVGSGLERAAPPAWAPRSVALARDQFATTRRVMSCCTVSGCSDTARVKALR